MISVYIYCRRKEEAESISDICSYCLALASDEHMAVTLGDRYITDDDNSESEPNLDIIIYEIYSGCEMEPLMKVRSRFPLCEIFLISDQRISPESYTIPEIRPSMLLIKPYTRARLSESLRRFLLYVLKKKHEENMTKRFMVCGMEERRFFDYKRIKYFEARDKKIILYHDHEYVSFYSSLKKIEDELPAYFVRCHRSFIVNMLHVDRINYAQYYLYLDEGISVPVSKKYGKELEEKLDSGCCGNADKG